MRTLALALLLSGATTVAAAADVDIYPHATVYNYVGSKGDPTYTDAPHDIEIRNNTDHEIAFSYTYQYCASRCVSTGNNARLGPHMVWNNHHDSYLSPNYSQPGHYPLDAMTTVTYDGVVHTYIAKGFIDIY